MVVGTPVSGAVMVRFVGFTALVLEPTVAVAPLLLTKLKIAVPAGEPG